MACTCLQCKARQASAPRAHQVADPISEIAHFRFCLRSTENEKAMQKKAMVDVDLKSSGRFSYSVHPQTDWVCQETGHCHFKNLVRKKKKRFTPFLFDDPFFAIFGGFWSEYRSLSVLSIGFLAEPVASCPEGQLLGFAPTPKAHCLRRRTPRGSPSRNGAFNQEK